MDLPPRGRSGRRTPDPSAQREARWPWALAGVGAAAAGIGVAEILAAMIGATSAPIIAIAQAFIDATPAWLKQFAISTFGTHDKQALLTGAGSMLFLVAVLAGLVARRHPMPAQVIVLGLGAVGALAAVTRPDAGTLWPVPSLAGAVFGAVVLGMIRSAAVRRGRAAR